jgi:hypothetical protein
MDIAIIQDDQVVEIGHYKKLFPATSFPTTGPDADFMAANNVLGVTIWKAHDSTTEKLSTCEPYIEDNQVFTVEVLPKTEDDLAADTLQLANDIRAKRNQLLVESDWTQIPDVPLDKEAWGLYRQALRDVTLQDGFPHDVIFPDKPA